MWTLWYNQVVEVDKAREEFSNNTFTVTIDNVKRLWCFMEIELIVNDESMKDEALNRILVLAQQLWLHKSDIEKSKYDAMLMNIKPKIS